VAVVVSVVVVGTNEVVVSVVVIGGKVVVSVEVSVCVLV